MTCVVGIEKNGVVVIGADSVGVSGYLVTIREDPKVVRNVHNPHLLLGCTTSFFMIDILRYTFVPPPLSPESEITRENLHRYLCTAFIGALRECFREEGFAKVENNQVSGGNFLLGLYGFLFEIEQDFQVSMPAPLDGIRYASVGSGAEVASGALYATQHTSLSSEERILLALRAAERHTTSVRAPYVIETSAPDSAGRRG